ncbi:polyprenol-phosphate-mannose-dependent alpha-(1-2)-phosphatidylinositol mannoside mannosyltransferase [Rhodococcoides trifolii]|uniref:Polyprenol-phosphate-mannose-dependent alpha-(1-2)-phosphatidylinositol mannoside mannosyltransferase n=1 Tax=Rhodococcoides trifolii TaxID=908250 RepID=A0A917D084_9NOCA|nr:glycosyltransferase 87 family protein [Rhodococcus trifolii]GGG05296.1 polyprenol-phosphate-mannose-dependent alpha-(1-2)-phosphatidylinositol mannoside mannosyltransferase [Rhodococcus trifolii]
MSTPTPTEYSGPTVSVPGPVRLLGKVVVSVAVVVGILYNLAGFPPLREFGFPYRIDLDVYRIGGGALLHGVDLYGPLPRTFYDIPLPFTYPPLAAISFSPMAAIPLNAAGTIMSLMSMGTLAITVFVALRALVTLTVSTTLWITAAVGAVAFALEPVWSTFDYGQINIVLMCLVTLDVLLKKTPWPRGTLIGAVTAIKLTPAVFVLYFLVKRDYRSAVVTGISFLVFTAIGFAITFSNSVRYWTEVLIDSSRIGNPPYISNQSITGLLARLGMDESLRTKLWIVISAVVLAIAVVAIHRALRAGQPLLALCVNAVLGLLVSPVSWSHHWVWAVPLMVALGYVALTRRSVVFAALVVSGILLMHYPAHWRLGQGRWNGLDWPLQDQMIASSYVWWGLACIVAVALLPDGRVRRPSRPEVETRPAPSPA